MDRRRIPEHAVIGIERQRRRLYPDDPAAGRAHFLAILGAGREDGQFVAGFGKQLHLAVDIGADAAAGGE